MRTTATASPTSFLPLAGLALLAACATTPPPPAIVVPAIPSVHGMDQLIGKPPETAVAILGQPTLDRQEGTSRQFQFTGACILDVWFYPQLNVGMRATYAAARLPDGRDVQPAQCFSMLQRKTR